MRTSRIVSLALLVFVGLGAAAPGQETVHFESADGFRLEGSLWSNDSGPGVLLLHQCNNQRTMYDELAAQLAGEGFKVLTVDFRGFGGSRTDDLDAAVPEQRMQAMRSVDADGEAAYSFLASQGSGSVAGALGASCGGFAVVSLGQAHEELVRMGFFSSGLSAERERDVLKLQGRQYLLIAARDDRGAARAAGTIAYRVGRDRSELLLYEGDAHGAPLFDQDPELVGKMVEFFKPLLEP
ncbi:MAG: alpha/beta fold hydrolase [Acidobacteriota bacterium]